MEKLWDSLGQMLISILDPNANRQSYTSSYVFGYYECCRPNFIHRRGSFFVERDCECGGWCWYVHVISFRLLGFGERSMSGEELC